MRACVRIKQKDAEKQNTLAALLDAHGSLFGRRRRVRGTLAVGRDGITRAIFGIALGHDELFGWECDLVHLQRQKMTTRVDSPGSVTASVAIAGMERGLTNPDSATVAKTTPIHHSRESNSKCIQRLPTTTEQC